MARGLSSCGARAELRHGMWDLLGPGIEPVSPALAGGFLTTAPPGKSHFSYFSLKWTTRVWWLPYWTEQITPDYTLERKEIVFSFLFPLLTDWKADVGTSHLAPCRQGIRMKVRK